jgi:hypothetical protein
MSYRGNYRAFSALRGDVWRSLGTLKVSVTVDDVLDSLEYPQVPCINGYPHRWGNF